jgi:metal-dependent amidase/aminoacylase/carboxypeptidase family protein
MMLAFHGLECMREHVRTGSRIHYTVMEGTGAANIVHPKAKAWVTMRASDKTYLEDMVRRMLKVIEGSAMMTETQVKVTRNPVFYDTVVNKTLCDASENNARLFGFDDVKHLDEADLQVCGGGATDFGNVSYVCPGILVRAEYNKGVAGHSPEHVALGKTQKATDFIRECAAIMAGVTYDFVTDADFRQAVKDEFKFRLREKGVEA